MPFPSNESICERGSTTLVILVDKDLKISEVASLYKSVFDLILLIMIDGEINNINKQAASKPSCNFVKLDLDKILVKEYLN
jgi:hypothetical protein